MIKPNLPIYVYPRTIFHGYLKVDKYVVHVETEQKVQERFKNNEVILLGTEYGFIYVNKDIPKCDYNRIKMVFEEACDNDNIYKVDGIFINSTSIIDRYLQDKIFPALGTLKKEWFQNTWEVMLNLWIMMVILYWFKAIELSFVTSYWQVQVIGYIIVYLIAHFLSYVILTVIFRQDKLQ